MKCFKSMALAMLATLGFTSAAAAEYQYVPLVQEGARWDYYSQKLALSLPSGTSNSFPFTISLEGDSVIHDVTYKKCWLTFYDNYMGLVTETEKTLYDGKISFVIALMREDDKKVYAVYTDDFLTFFKHSGFGKGVCLKNTEEPSHYDEWLIYDFNDVAGTLNQARSHKSSNYLSYDYTVLGVENVEINGALRKSYNVGVYMRNIDDSLVYEKPQDIGLRIIEGVGMVQSATPKDIDSTTDPFLFLNPNADEVSIPKIGLVGLTYVNFRQMKLNGKTVVKSYDFVGFDDVDSDNPSGVDDLATDFPSDDSYYDLMGRKVNPENMASGIYIHNHKKVMVNR